MMPDLDRRSVNIPVALLSLVTSAVLWLVVFFSKLPADVTRVIYVRVNTVGLNEDRYVVLKQPERLQVVLRGPEERIREIAESDVTALVDLGSAFVGTRRYPVTLIGPEGPADPMLERRSLYAVVEIDELVRKQFVVRGDSRGQLGDSTYILKETLVEPSKVRLRGPRSQMNRVERVRAAVDLGSVESGVPRPQPAVVEILDSRGRPLTEVRSDPPMVNVIAVTDFAPRQKSVWIYAEIRGRVAAGYQAVGSVTVPASVRVTGPSRLIAQMSQITTEPISVEGLRETRTFRAKLLVPQGIAAERKEVQVQVTVRRDPLADGRSNGGPVTGTGGNG